jgi:hypothetical protein
MMEHTGRLDIIEKRPHSYNFTCITCPPKLDYTLLFITIDIHLTHFAVRMIDTMVPWASVKEDCKAHNAIITVPEFAVRFEYSVIVQVNGTNSTMPPPKTASRTSKCRELGGGEGGTEGRRERERVGGMEGRGREGGRLRVREKSGGGEGG